MKSTQYSKLAVLRFDFRPRCKKVSGILAMQFNSNNWINSVVNMRLYVRLISPDSSPG